MASLNSLSKMTVPGTKLELSESFGGWVANYEIRIEGAKRRKNIGASADTVQEAVQKANIKLAKYLVLYQPKLMV